MKVRVLKKQLQAPVRCASIHVMPHTYEMSYASIEKLNICRAIIFYTFVPAMVIHLGAYMTYITKEPTQQINIMDGVFDEGSTTSLPNISTP